jgi:phosphoglycolate phosphatase
MRAIIFDLDGTLIDSEPDIQGAFAAAFAGLGVPTPPASDLRSVIGRRLEDCFARFLAGDQGRSKEGARLFREYYQDHYLDATRPYPGAGEALRALAARAPLALCTMKKWQFARKIVRAFGWENLFAQVLGSEEGFAAKPDPAMLLELCRRLEVMPSEVLYVGDTELDGLMAQAAGSPFAFAVYGYGGGESMAHFAVETRLGTAYDMAHLARGRPARSTLRCTDS